MTLSANDAGTSESGDDIIAAFAAALRAWWKNEEENWDSLVESNVGEDLSVDIWDQMPVIDSKAVARSSPLFRKHLGIPLDTKLIRPGGYASIEEVIADLVPKMVARKDATEAGSRGKNEEAGDEA